ncbi:MAG: hypothetical protein AB4372_37045 [Xenococcus sp. (in: cyanobacteria)]
MAFNPDDWISIIQYLGLSMSDESNVKAAMANLETNTPEIIPKVQALLSELTNLQATISTELSSPNSGLIKADVLEYESSESRNSGMFLQEARIIDQIYRLLNLKSFGVILPVIEEESTSNIPTGINHGW